MKILESLYQSLEMFGDLRKRSINVLKCSESLRECSQIFRKLRKRFKSVSQMYFMSISDGS